MLDRYGPIPEIFEKLDELPEEAKNRYLTGCGP